MSLLNSVLMMLVARTFGFESAANSVTSRAPPHQWSDSLLCIYMCSWCLSSSSYLPLSKVVSLHQFDLEGSNHTVAYERLMLICLLLDLWEAVMWSLVWGAINRWFLKLGTWMNLSSTAEVILGIPFLGPSQFHHSVWWYLQPYLKMHFKFLQFFPHIDWPSCLKVMTDCRLPFFSRVFSDIKWITTVDVT